MPVACNWAAPARAASDSLVHPSPSAELNQDTDQDRYSIACGLCGQDPQEEMYKTRHAMSPHSTFVRIPYSEKTFFCIFLHFFITLERDCSFSVKTTTFISMILESSNKYVYLVPSSNSLDLFHKVYKNRTQSHLLSACVSTSVTTEPSFGLWVGEGGDSLSPRLITPFFPQNIKVLCNDPNLTLIVGAQAPLSLTFIFSALLMRCWAWREWG
jgi:hypothetical protein